MTLYSLTDDELVLLDGRCRPELQTSVDDAKARIEMSLQFTSLTPKEAGLVADMVSEAKREGRLTFVRTSIRQCSVCEQVGGFALYRGGRNRGKRNLDKPIMLSGVDFARGFVTVQGHVSVGCCWDCYLRIVPSARAALAHVRAALPVEIMAHAPKWLRFDRMKCEACGWEGHEGEMGKLPALLGGSYYGECPKCHAQNRAFGPMTIRNADGFALVAAPEGA